MSDTQDPLRTIGAIVGPTGAGKSAIALAVAERVGATLISADSRQLFRAFDIGTAKPTRDERTRVPHHGVDVAEPTERWSAARWAAAADEWIAACDEADRAPLLVGGTGFYLRALAAPLFAEPPLDPERRVALARELDPLPTDALRARIAMVDPPSAHAQRAQLLRAIEVFELTGVSLSTWQAIAPRPPRLALRYLVVDPGPALAMQLSARTEAMVAAGWLAEVDHLTRHVPDDAPAWHATGYGVWRAHLSGELGRAEARAQVEIATRQYAKRQRTWFRHQLPPSSVTMLDPTRPDALDVALAWWSVVARTPMSASLSASRPSRQ